MVILLDSGATHNFISNKVVTKLNILMHPVNFVVVLGDDQRVKGLGICDRVEPTFQGIRIIQNFFYSICEELMLSKLGNVKSN